jgi:hypothetical protein
MCPRWGAAPGAHQAENINLPARNLIKQHTLVSGAFDVEFGVRVPEFTGAGTNCRVENLRYQCVRIRLGKSTTFVSVFWTFVSGRAINPRIQSQILQKMRGERLTHPMESM